MTRAHMAGAEPWDPGQIRTLMSLGDSCPDRGVAFAALTEGRGWDWVFGGGTARYTRVYPNPVPEGFVGYFACVLTAVLGLTLVHMGKAIDRAIW